MPSVVAFWGAETTVRMIDLIIGEGELHIAQVFLVYLEHLFGHPIPQGLFNLAIDSVVREWVNTEGWDSA